MKDKAKIRRVFFFAVASLFIFMITTAAAMEILTRWYGLIIGIALMVLAVPFHILGKKRLVGYYISFLLNSIGNGFSVSAYYIVKGVPFSAAEAYNALALPVLILLLSYVLLIFFKKKTALIITAGLNAICLIASVVFWIIDGRLLFSFAFFALLITMFYLCVFGITINHKERSVMRDISFGGFGSFVIVTVVVIAILSEGEILEGLGFDIDTGNNKRKKAK